MPPIIYPWLRLEWRHLTTAAMTETQIVFIDLSTYNVVIVNGKRLLTLLTYRAADAIATVQLIVQK